MPRFLARSGRGHVVEVANGLPSPAWGAAASAQGAYGFPSAPARCDLTVFVLAPGRPRRIDTVPPASTDARAPPNFETVSPLRRTRSTRGGSASPGSTRSAAGPRRDPVGGRPGIGFDGLRVRGGGPGSFARLLRARRLELLQKGRRTGAVDRRHGFGRPCPLAPQESPRGLRRPRRPRSKPQRTVSPIQGIPGCPGPNLGSGVLLRRAPAPAL